MAEEIDDDEAYFSELLSKRGDEWLTNALKKMGVKVEAPKPEAPTPAAPSRDGFVGFLSAELADLKKALEKRSDQLERALDMLTNEQRQTLRQSLLGAGAEPPASRPNKKPNEQPSEPPKKRFLQRL